MHNTVLIDTILADASLRENLTQMDNGRWYASRSLPYYAPFKPSAWVERFIGAWRVIRGRALVVQFAQDMPLAELRQKKNAGRIDATLDAMASAVRATPPHPGRADDGMAGMQEED